MNILNHNQHSQNSLGNPSFKMRVNLLPRHMDWQHKLLKSEEICDMPYTIKNMIKSSRALYTDNVCDCAVLGVSNGKESFLTHLVPNGKNLDSMSNFDTKAKLNKTAQEELQKNIDNLKSQGQKIKAFIVGGQIFEQEESRSISLFKELQEILGKNDIKPTVFWGQGTNGKLNAFYSVKDDTLSLFPSCSISKGKVKKYFNSMQFNEGDEVLLSGKKKIDTKKLHKEDASLLDIKKTAEDYYGNQNKLFNRVA